MTPDEIQTHIETMLDALPPGMSEDRKQLFVDEARDLFTRYAEAIPPLRVGSVESTVEAFVGIVNQVTAYFQRSTEFLLAEIALQHVLLGVLLKDRGIDPAGPGIGPRLVER